MNAKEWFIKNHPGLLEEMAEEWSLLFATNLPSIMEDYHQAKSEEVCKWRYDENHDYWDTECDHAYCLISGTLKENDHIHCPYCGKRIKEVNK